MKDLHISTEAYILDLSSAPYSDIDIEEFYALFVGIQTTLSNLGYPMVINTSGQSAWLPPKSPAFRGSLAQLFLFLWVL